MGVYEYLEMFSDDRFWVVETDPLPHGPFVVLHALEVERQLRLLANHRVAKVSFEKRLHGDLLGRHSLRDDVSGRAGAVKLYKPDGANDGVYATVGDLALPEKPEESARGRRSINLTPFKP